MPESKKKQYMSIYMKEYFQNAFYEYELLLQSLNYRPDVYHPIRKQFWSTQITKEYQFKNAHDILKEYLKVLEDEIQKIIAKQSIAYWLHLYRRILPYYICNNKRPEVIALTRTTLEAAIQKYGQCKMCDRVAFSNNVSLDKILNGNFIKNANNEDIEHLSNNGQLVLTKHGYLEHKQFYQLEKLAYEVMIASARIRGVSKGSKIVVLDTDEYYIEDRTDELNKLITLYDKRISQRRNISYTRKGVIFAKDNFGSARQGKAGLAFFPHYNVGLFSKSEGYAHTFLSDTYMQFEISGPPNFMWYPFNMRDYYEGHKALEQAFYYKHNIKLSHALLIICIIYLRWWYMRKEMSSIGKVFQRAYEGPYTKEWIINELKNYIEDAAYFIGLTKKEINNFSIEQAIEFWSLPNNREDIIDVVCPGPHYLFLPCNDDRWFIDSCWIYRRLYDLFFSVKLDDENWKSDLLEEIVRKHNNALTNKELKGFDGSSKQVDAAFPVKKNLIIVECKVNENSIGYDRGLRGSIEHRINNIDIALSDVDDKAEWLTEHPKGKNYDVSMYENIIPVAVSPFVEYIPSMDSKYWLFKDIPRVFTPDEFDTHYNMGTFNSIENHMYKIDKEEVND